MSSFTKKFKVNIHNVSLKEKPFEIAETFFYWSTKVKGLIIEIPYGYRSNFASVPRLLWFLFPPVDRYSKAAVVHDWLIDNKDDMKLSYHKINVVFLESMKVLKVSIIRRYVMYWAVESYWHTLGPIWKFIKRTINKEKINE